MVDNRDSFRLNAAGGATVGVKDRWEAPFSGDVVDVVAVVGTAPTGGPLTFQLRLDGAVIATGSIAAGTTEVNVVVPATIPFTTDQTFDLNISVVGVTVAGSDLEVTVEYVNK